MAVYSRHQVVTHVGPAETARASKRTRARARRWAGRLLAFLPTLAILGTDVALRGSRLAALDWRWKLGYAGTIVLGGCLWGTLLLVAARRRGLGRWFAAALLSVAAILVFGGQVYAFHRYQAFLDDDSVLVGTSMMPSVKQQLWFDRVGLLRAVMPPLLGVLTLILIARRLAPTKRKPAVASLDAAVVLATLIALATPAHGDQKVAFDILYLSGMGRLARAHWDHNGCVERLHPGPRSPLPVPHLTPRPVVPRNVLLVVTESVRSMSSCVAYDKGCVHTPFSNAQAPDRIPFTQMRAVDSTTAISLSVMWSGLSPTESRAALHSAPLVWEYAHAAGFDTAYWTSQNLLFGNAGAWLDGVPFEHHVNGTELELNPTLEIGADDVKLVAHVIGHLGELREPFLAVVHLSNTHFPYLIDESDAPFVPESEESGPGHESEIRNRYEDAIYRQDRAIGRLISAARKQRTSLSTVIFFISDHGEQMHEKGAVGHTGTLFEPEIRIPAWLDAPPGALTVAEESTLRSLTEKPLTTLDVMPTLLDLMGLWDAPEIAPMRGRMPGHSLMRGGSAPEEPVFMTNCSELWACAFKNWGVMSGTRKLIATQADHAWNCFDVATDPDEENDLGPAGCGALVTFAEAGFHGRPF
jgi:glucan phosphoethanolaminetransferase (alkaline phosphatase superfamily)